MNEKIVNKMVENLGIKIANLEIQNAELLAQIKVLQEEMTNSETKATD